MMRMIIVIFLFIMFMIWTYCLVNKKLERIDNYIYSTIKINDKRTKVMKHITNLASSKFLVLACFLFLIILENKRLAVLLIISLLFNSLLIGLIKNIFKRPRPNIKRLVNEKGYSYASGHTMCATCFYGLLIFLVGISGMIMPIKILLLSIFSILILLVGYSRIYLGVHYFSDVLGGLLLGNSYIILYIYIINNILNLI